MWDLGGFKLVTGKSISIRIDSHCRIVIKNFDSVLQLQRFSYVHHCAARSRHDSHSRQCRYSLLQRQLAALLQCGPAGYGFDHGTGPAASGPESRTPGVDCRGRFWQSSESNQTESNRLVCCTESNWIESFSFLRNRPSLVQTGDFYNFSTYKPLYLRNGARYDQGYYWTLIGNRISAFDWYQNQRS